MIELNCNYEESKKILELGYDFSRVCLEFNEIKTNKKFIKTNETQVILMDNGFDLNDLSGLEWYDDVTTEYLIPIIPKATLEACLPDYLLKRGCNLFYHVRKFMGELYWVNSRDESLTEDWFSPFRAFIWCHENYPEELKKKFDEVMG